jgi:phosphate transport system permease protein
MSGTTESAASRWCSRESILQNRARQKRRQRIAFIALGVAAGLAVAILLVIVGFIVVNGAKDITWEFLSSDVKKAGEEGGIFPLILNTLYLVGLGLLLAVPLSLLAAIYMTEYARQGLLIKIIRYFTTNLAGIPSIIFGLFGFLLFGKIMKIPWTLLGGSATIAIVILPTLIRTYEEAILTVPVGYKEGSLALGTTKWRTMVRIVIPAAAPGIMSGTVLGIGRIVGETAALFFTLGSGARLATSLLDSARSLSLHLYILATETPAVGKAYATATVLIVIGRILNLIAGAFGSRVSRHKEGI